MPPPIALNRSLAANALTAFVPTSLGVVNRVRDAIPGLSRALQPRSAVAAPSRPGNVQALDGENAASSVSLLPLVQPARSSKALPQLPLAMHDEIRGRFQAINTAGNPTNWDERGNGDLKVGEHRWSDAFRATVQTDDGQRLPVLPEALLHSSLLNAGLDGQLAWCAKDYTLDDINTRIGEIREDIAERVGDSGALPPQRMTDELAFAEQLLAYKNAAGGQGVPPASLKGQTLAHLPNTLLDTRTGMAASISLLNGREVQINFSGMGSQRRGVLQGARAFFDRLGWWTPKSYSQASKLTQMVAKHLEVINQGLPDGEKLSLSLSGHSMGGALATYAALRNGVPATVINPLRLGIGTRAKVGQANIRNAPKLVTEVVVQGDWVADNKHAKHIYNRKARLISGGSPSDGIGQRFMLPAPSYQQRLDYANRVWPEGGQASNEEWARNFDAHNDLPLCMTLASEAAQAAQ